MEEYTVVKLTPHDIATYIRRIKNLKRYKKLNDNECRFMAICKLSEKSLKKIQQVKRIESLEKDDFGLRKYFSSKKDVDLGTELLEKYINEFSFSSDSEKDTLKELVWYEVSLAKIREEANKALKESSVLSDRMMKQIETFSKLILELKGKLGILQDKKFEEGESPAQRWNKLMERCEVWAKEHGISRTIKCPHCARIIALRMRVENYESSPHPYYIKDRLYWNKTLYDLYLRGKINKMEFAASLYVAPEYIDWMESHYSKEILN